jgi:CDP-glycerol glycerophosphotransferase
MRRLARFFRYHVGRIRYERQARNRSVDAKRILFSAYYGRNYACSPKALYEHLLQAEQEGRGQGYRFVWAVVDVEKHAFLLNNPGTTLVKYGSADYFRALQGAACWVLNFRVPDHVWPKQNQFYIQCWHGTPMKKIGFDLNHSDNAMNSRQEIHRKYELEAMKFHWLLSPSSFATEKFISAWNLRTYGRADRILEIGYPRNDRLVTFDSANLPALRKTIGLQGIGDKKVVLYAPTWRDNQYDPASGYSYDLNINFDRLREELGERCILLFRVHYLVRSHFDFARYRGFIFDVSAWDDINDLYLISDLLMTDYSSVAFDYGNLGRPMVFYMYDLPAYGEQIRGLYFDVNELPGEIVTEPNRLAGAIWRALDGVDENAEYQRKYEAFQRRYNGLDDGLAASRLATEISAVLQGDGMGDRGRPTP